ncbi:translocation/assembly module TamB domain-containing protein [Pseudoalteromonas aurantia]|uniref:Translocation and assembly module TamB C-terminal domain-containing protein n=1 Tax=Pseudoalteromonas aurantia TaxID=43654 RepID=A0A5S3VDS3_9GAMM|nr:translocation/assembly module TamB domain-containing protein [Pseudoalteromonas aurantia]TMO70454.1 hypothetical protein CWC19_01165 [Pseudoalteromonas aurantia]
MLYRKLRKIQGVYAFVGLLLFVLGMLFTLTGNQLLLSAVSRVIPELDMSVTNRTMFSGGEINFTYQSKQQSITGSNIHIEMSWFDCDTLCIKSDVDHIEVTQHDTADVAVNEPVQAMDEQGSNVTEGNDISSVSVTFPISITLKYLNVKRLMVNSPTQTVSLDDFKLSASLQESTVQIDMLQLSSVNLELIQQIDSQTNKLETIIPALVPKEVFLPLTVNVVKAYVSEISIAQAQQQHVLREVEMSLSVMGSHFQLSDVHMAYKDLHLRSNAQLNTKDWRVDSFTTLTTPTQLLSLKTMGTFSNLTVVTRGQGSVAGHVVSHLDLTTPNWPFTVEGAFTQKARVAGGVLNIGSIEAGELTLQAQGHANKYHAVLQGSANATKLGTLSSHISLHGGMTYLNVDEAKLTINEARTNFKAELDWNTEVFATIQGDLQKLPLGILVENIQTRLTGEFHAKFNKVGEAWQLAVDKLSLKGDSQDVPLGAEVKLTLNEQGYGAIEQLELNYGESIVQLSGVMGDEIDLSGRFNIDHKQNALLAIDAHLTGEVTLKGDHNHPHIYVKSNVSHIKYDNAVISNGKITADVNLEKGWESDINMTFAHLSLANEQLENITLSLAGNKQQHTIHLNSAGTIATQIEIQGGLEKAQWQGRLSHAKITYLDLPIELVSPVQFLVSNKKSEIMPHCWAVKRSEVCLQAQHTADLAGHAAMSLSKVDLSDFNTLTDKFQMAGVGKGEINAKWFAGELLDANGVLDFKDTSIRADFAQQARVLPAESINVVMRSDKDHMALDWHLTSSLFGNLKGDMDVPIADYRHATAKLIVDDVNLAKLSPFMEQVVQQPMALSGILNADVSILNGFQKPSFHGAMQLTQFAVKSPVSPVAIHKSNVEVTFNKQQADIKGLFYAVEGGDLALSGDLVWQESLALSLNASGQDFLVSPQPGIELGLSPDLTITYAHNQAEISGELVVPYGRIAIESLPQGVVQVSDDQYILDEQIVGNDDLLIDYDLDLSMKILDDLRVTALGLDSYITGDLDVTKQSETPLIVTGELSLREGKYRAFGQDLLIDHGQIGFNGSPDKPYLNVSAIRNPQVTADNVKVGVELTGSATQSVLTVFSEPAMDQAQALAYLLNGEPLGQSDSDNNTMLTQFLLSQSIERSEGVVAKAGEKLGINDVNLTAKGSGDSTQVEVSGYITPNVQVSYRVGVFDSLSEIAVRYRVFSKMYIEATSGLYDSIDLLYKFDRGE